ncbi:MAG: phosphoglucosamine mutase [Actinomycetia bacterium]|nr:phosphoglucosamine mutase [Actinomycetota bacterium]MCG2795501.1 phosphoglucosamine mutase [Actinomycetes bacterium]
MKKYFGTDGIRGEANRDLTPELALRLGRAAVRAMGGAECRIVVGRDTRVSGPMLEDALVAGLLAEGAQVLLAGVLPTPAIAFLTEDIGATAGVVISASHNHYRDNGIKFFGPGGLKLPDDTEKAIEVEFEGLAAPEQAGEVGTATALEDAERLYIDHLLSCASFDLTGFKVALDCANGSAHRVCPIAFESLGAEVEAIGTHPDGENINRGCGSNETDGLVQLVTGWRADIGFALDGDADRCICVDETGEVRDGDFMMVVTAGYLKERDLLHPPLVVSTVMSNLGFYKALEEMGIRSIKTKVGDRYVSEEMLSNGALIGGEQSGHIIFSEHASTGDGTLTALLLAGMVKEWQKTLSELSGAMRKYPQVLLNVRPKSGRRLEPGMAVWDKVSGYQEALGGSGRILVRSSGTEPLERVMVEAASKVKAEEIAQDIADAISRELDH